VTFAILGAFCTHNVRIFRGAELNAKARKREDAERDWLDSGS